MKYFKPNIKFHDRLKNTEGIEINYHKKLKEYKEIYVRIFD